MSALTNNDRQRKTLASQLDRLDGILDALSDGFREAVETVVEQVVGRVVSEAVRTAVTGALADAELRRRLDAAQARPGLRAKVGRAVRRGWKAAGRLVRRVWDEAASVPRRVISAVAGAVRSVDRRAESCACWAIAAVWTAWPRVRLMAGLAHRLRK